jgi:enamine deaminase RidA (YjgF/YER057c/UK114 family)
MPFLIVTVLLALSGCSSISSIGGQLGQINSQLGTINGQFATTLKNQEAVVATQGQLMARIQTDEQAAKVDTTKVDTVLQKDVTAVVDLLKLVPTEGLPPRATAAVAGALSYATAAQTESGGVYTGANRVNAPEIATGATSLPTVQANVGVDLATYTKAHDDLVASQNQVNTLQTQLAATTTSLSHSDTQLQSVSTELSTLRDKLTWDKIWDYIKTPLGLVICVVLLIAFPALIPIIGAIIGRLVAMFPALMNFFGVVHKDAFGHLSTGVDNFKGELDKLGDDAQVAVGKIKDLLASELSKATTSLDRRISSHVRSTKNGD